MADAVDKPMVDNTSTVDGHTAALVENFQGGKKRKASIEIPADPDEQPEKKRRKASAKKGVAKPVKPKKKAAPKKNVKADKDVSPDPVGRPFTLPGLAKAEDEQPAKRYRTLLEDLIEAMWQEEAIDSPTYHSKLISMPFEELYPTSVYCKAMHYLETAISQLDRIAIMARHEAELSAQKLEKAKKEAAREERIQRDAAKASGVRYEMWKRIKSEAVEAYEASTARSQQKLIREFGSEEKAKTSLFHELMRQYREDEEEAEHFFDPEIPESATKADQEGGEAAQEAAVERDDSAQPQTASVSLAELELAQNEVPKPTAQTFPDELREAVAQPVTTTKTQPEDDVAAASNASVFDEEQAEPPMSAKVREAKVNRLLAQINAGVPEESTTPRPAMSAATMQVSGPSENVEVYESSAVPTGPLRLPPPGVSLPGLFAEPPKLAPAASSQPVVEQDAAKPASEQGHVVVESSAAVTSEVTVSHAMEGMSGTASNREPELVREEVMDPPPARQTQRLALPPASAAIGSRTPIAALSGSGSSIAPYRRPSERLEDETDYDDSPVQGAFDTNSAPAAASAEQEGKDNGKEDHDEELFGAEDGSDANPYEDEDAEQGDDEPDDHNTKHADQNDEDAEQADDEDVEEDDQLADHLADQLADQVDEDDDEEVAYEDQYGAQDDEDEYGGENEEEEQDVVEKDADDEGSRWLREHGMKRPKMPPGWKY